MALSVQTDSTTVVEGADSYVSLTEADAYFADHGSPAAWTAASEPTKEAALRYATRWVDQRYAWIGIISDATLDRLLWPRIDAIANGRDWIGVPHYIREAVCEVALLHVGGGAAAVNASPARGGRISSVTVDVITVDFEPGAPGGVGHGYIDQLIYGAGLAYGLELLRA